MVERTVQHHRGRQAVLRGMAMLIALGLLVRSGYAEDEKKKDDEKPVTYERIVKIPKYVKDNPKKYNLQDSDLDVIASINKRIEAGWRENNVTPSRPATDFEFARRAYLDIIGRIPTPEEITVYIKQHKPEERRIWLVNQLLASEEYPRHWANLWANWSLGRAGVFGAGMYKQQLQDWFKDEFAANTPQDKLIQKLLTASGRNTDAGNGAVNFILAHVGEPTVMGRVPNAAEIRRNEGQFQMVPLTSRITRLFLGIQTQCTQCHDHPFDANLKQEHFWGINAFLRQVERDGQLPRRPNDALGPLTLKINTGVNKTAVVQYEKRNGLLLETKATFFASKNRLDRDAQTEDRRPEMVKFLLAHDNFPKAQVNRMWATFLGVGFVNPIDDFNDNNIASHPDLLDELGASYKNYGYDQKQLIRWITLSDAYNLSPVANKSNDKKEHETFFSRMVLKNMSPEQLFESMMIATMQKKPGEDLGEVRRRWLDNLVQNFGDDEGNEITFNGTIVQSLLMMNGDDINSAISEKDKSKGAVAYVMDKFPSDATRIQYLYLATLGRIPSTEEQVAVLQKMRLYKSKTDSADARFHDLMWALLNSNEFILNH